MLRVDTIESFDPVGPSIAPYGLIVPSGMTISSSGGVNVVGILSSTSFAGNGAGITGIPATTTAKAIALTIII